MNKKFVRNCIILGIIFLIYGFFVEPNIITVKHYEIEDSQLKGLKVVFVSDFYVVGRAFHYVYFYLRHIAGNDPTVVGGRQLRVL